MAISYIFAYARGSFELKGLGIGVVFGGLFALFPLVYGLGQKIDLSDKEISYSSNLLTLFISKYKKKLLLSEINEIRLGMPKINKNHTTFASINISTPYNEISFNPDLFSNITLHDLFLELKVRNQNIKLDNYSHNLIEKGKDSNVFRKTVFSNFVRSLLFKLGIISK